MSEKEKSQKRRTLQDKTKVHAGEGHPKYRGDLEEGDAMVAWFMAALRVLEDPERVETKNDDVKWVQQPVRLPTFTGYSIHRGVTTKTLLEWRTSFDYFGDCYQHCKDIQSEVLVHMGSTGSFNPPFAMLMAKNFQGWKERVEHEQNGPVTLHFDKDDEEA